LKPKSREYDGKCPEIISGGGLTLLKILKSLFDYPLKKKSHNITISKFLFQSPDRYVSSFIRGYFDCDGGVEFTRRAVSISSASQKMLKNLQLLLLRFACLSTLQNHRLFISGSSAKQFRDNINFDLVEKKKKLSKLCETIIGSYTSDLIPISGDQLKKLRSGNPGTQVSHHFYKYEQGVYNPTRTTLSSFMKTLEKMNCDTELMKKMLSPDIAFIQVKKIAEDYADYVYDFTIEPHQNFMAESIIIHNTTLSDSLLANAGLLNPSLAGDVRALDFLEEEQRRGITIKAANISLLHEYQGSRYVVNLVDTPGHVDFSGKVTRALRAIDGAIVVVDAVEGVMAQTESVIRSAIKERVKPVLYINKIDRLIRELKLSPKQIQDRLAQIIQDVNKIITFASENSNEIWKVGTDSGTVAFGSALHRWAFTVESIQRANLQFKDIIEIYRSETIEKLSTLLPIHLPILSMILDQLPSPKIAQNDRVKHIWKGSITSPAGKALRSCDSDGPLIIGVTKVISQSKHGLIAVGRLFSGTIRKGTQIQVFPSNELFKTQRVTLFMGSRQVVIPSLTAGNICGIIGLEEIQAGDTITGQHNLQGMVPFEEITYISEPVVTIAIEPNQTKDLPRLLTFLENLTKSDPNLVFLVNERTGENLLSGLGLLHLEIAVKDIEKTGIQVYASEPIVLYRETVRSIVTLDNPHMSPNGKNSVRISIYPRREVNNEENIWKRDTRGNILLNLIDTETSSTVKDAIIAGFDWAMERGPLCSEPVGHTVIQIEDMMISSEIAERSKVELMSMVREAIFVGFEKTGLSLLEPLYNIQVIVPNDFHKETVKVIMSKRGQVEDLEFTRDWVTITGSLPVGESFDIADALRSRTSGKAIWQTKFSRWQAVPEQRATTIISEIKKRRGLH
jgi:elongation factor 2